MPKLTADRARELLSYDAETGALVWRKRGKGTFDKRYAGKPAGCWSGNSVVDGAGAIVVRVDDRLYKAHRVIWLIVTGKWPKGDVDHINRDPTDNRWANLRDVSHEINMRNMRPRKDSGGIKGVSLHSPSGKWRARLRHEGKEVFLGLHTTREAAIKARKQAEADYGYAGG